MKMYKCNDCGKTFEYPKVVEEMLGYYGDLPYYEPFAYCPHCNGDDFEDWYSDKVKTMDGCWVAEKELLYNPTSDTLYWVDIISEDGAEVYVVKRDEEGEALTAEDGSYVCEATSEVLAREVIEDTMEGM